MPDAAILNGTKRHPGTKHGKACAKCRFRGSADVVSLCGTDQILLDFVVLYPCASFRDAIPIALRLPRRCAPRNDTKMVGFYENLPFLQPIYLNLPQMDTATVFPSRYHFTRI